jgi:hypothetical protein
MFLFLKNLKELLKEEWANGTFTSEDVQGTIQLNSVALGKVHLLEDLFDLNYEWLIEDLANGK